MQWRCTGKARVREKLENVAILRGKNLQKPKLCFDQVYLSFVCVRDERIFKITYNDARHLLHRK